MSICTVSGCARKAEGFGRLCNSHRIRNRRHGDPLQATITTARLRPYVTEIRRYVERAGGDALWADLETLWSGAVTRARGIMADYQAGRPSFQQEVRAANDLVAVASEVPTRRIIETVAAMALMQEQDARAFRSDRAFWAQTARRFRGLGTRHATLYLGRDGRKHRVYRDPNQLAAVTLGRWLVEAVGNLGRGVHHAFLAEHERLSTARAAVYAAMRGAEQRGAAVNINSGASGSGNNL